jgi:endonuclease-8
MAGKTVTRFTSVYPHLNRVDEDTPIAGRTVEDVQAAGKHLLFFFSNDLVLRSHLRMNGRWHLYRAGEPWRRGASGVRVLIATGDVVAVGFHLHDVSLHSRRTLLRDSPVGALGPDLLGDTFDERAALQRLRRPPDLPVAMALLDQRRLAGIGNVYKSETLFLCRIDPFTPVSRLDDAALLDVMRQARTLMQANVAEGSSDRIVTYRGLRRTTGRSNPAERLWVYARGGRPCRRCGTPIERRKMGEDARTTYYCPRCQAPTARGA